MPDAKPLSTAKTLKDLPIVKLLCSLRITFGLLICFFVLTLLGTLYQVDHGLYDAQQTYFFSWYVFLYDIVPFPGAKLIMFLSFINLSAVHLFRFRYRRRQIGLILAHTGIIILLLGGFLTHYYATESSIALRENETTNTSEAYHRWELAIWLDKDQKRAVEAFEINRSMLNKKLTFRQSGIQATLNRYYENSRPLMSGDNEIYSNPSGIVDLRRANPDKEPGRNRPGITLTITVPGETSRQVLLYADERLAEPIVLASQTYAMKLRRVRYPLPFHIRLVDFRKKDYLGTKMAKSYESTVEISEDGKEPQQVIISMNNPLRRRDYTLFQSSFIQDNGIETSIFSVVENRGRLLPYISSLVVFVGLLIHFLLKLTLRLRKDGVL